MTTSKYSTVGLALFASVALSVFASAATLAPNIQYSFTGTFAGTLNGVSFNTPVRISMLSNTADNTSKSSTSGLTTTTIYNLYGVTTFDIGDDGLDVVTMTSLNGTYVTPYIAASRAVTLGIYSESVNLRYENSAKTNFSTRAIMGTVSSSYDFSGPVTYTFGNNPSSFASIETTGGTLLFSSGGPVTLTATAVPEPSAAALLGLGTLALVRRRKR
jgi:hypothetical protein